jgi:6-phosphogluconolactonase (cycloisomerase 2 family)
MKSLVFSSSIVGAFCFATQMASADPGLGAGSNGAVYTIDNAPSINNVLVFARTANGQIIPEGAVPTGGAGTGSGLGSQGAVLLSHDAHWLFVCNAGSDDISVFSVGERGLRLSDQVSSQGKVPISLTLRGNLLYALNAGGSAGTSDNIAGFIFADGRLHALASSPRALSAANTGPAEVSFTSDGNVLVVTEKNTSQIDTFTVGDDGLVQDHKVFSSPAATPFGFSAGRHDRIYVSNAAGSSLSSYAISEDGNVEVISNAIPTEQNAACWVALTGDERFAYTANAASGSISGFRIAPDGSLTLLTADGRTGVTGDGSHPIDMALSHDSRYLYSLDSGDGMITIFRVEGNGSLDSIPGVDGVPTSASGLAVW